MFKADKHEAFLVRHLRWSRRQVQAAVRKVRHPGQMHRLQVLSFLFLSHLRKCSQNHRYGVGSIGLLGNSRADANVFDWLTHVVGFLLLRRN
jgi:hypothetical protein